MGPILEAYGGGFRYDFWIRETLKSESSDPIDRVFAIYFQDKPGMEEFLFFTSLHDKSASCKFNKTKHLFQLS